MQTEGSTFYRADSATAGSSNKRPAEAGVEPQERPKAKAKAKNKPKAKQPERQQEDPVDDGEAEDDGNGSPVLPW